MAASVNEQKVLIDFLIWQKGERVKETGCEDPGKNRSVVSSFSVYLQFAFVTFVLKKSLILFDY